MRKVNPSSVLLALVIVIVLILLLIAITEPADAAEIVDGCPQPLRPQVWLPLVGQDHYAGMWSCFEHPYRCLGR